MGSEMIEKVARQVTDAEWLDTLRLVLASDIGAVRRGELVDVLVRMRRDGTYQIPSWVAKDIAARVAP